MLAVALDIKVDVGGKTKLDWQRETLLEILIGLFTRKLADQVRKGMPRRYLEHEDDLSVLRGRLNATRQFTKLIAQPDRIACSYDDLSPDIVLNQVMKAVVHRLMRLSRSSENQRLLRELAFTYADIRSVEPSALAWNSLVLDRTNSRWRELVDLARLLMGERYQTTSAGKVDGFSLMFDMSRLFEAYITQQLRRVVRGTGLTVHAQGGRLFCLQETDTGKQRFMTKPDILICRGAQVEVIIDTKWKRISRRIDDAKQSVNQGDVYQMIAYGHLYKCRRMVLLYPHHSELAAEAGLLNRHGITGTAHVLSTETVDLSGDALSQLTVSLERMLAASTSTSTEQSIAAEMLE
jgi:5-methylcytosine-specific restriction enzyme subunit McrC